MTRSSGSQALTEAVYYILLALHEPTHGYGIMKYIRNLTNDRVIIGSGTLYGAINKLIKNGWIKIDDNYNNDKKCYLITDDGKEIVVNEVARLKSLTSHGESIIGGNDNDL